MTNYMCEALCGKEGHNLEFNSSHTIGEIFQLHINIATRITSANSSHLVYMLFFLYEIHAFRLFHLFAYLPNMLSILPQPFFIIFLFVRCMSEISQYV